MYNVCVPNPPALYAKRYFPRKFKYKKEAIECAKTAIDNGADFVRVEYPNGVEQDFRPKGGKDGTL